MAKPVLISGMFKIFRIMKLMIFLSLIGVIQVFAGKSFSQTTNLTLELKNASIESVLQNIEDQSRYVFFYNKDMIDVTRRVDIHLADASIEEVLEHLFDGTRVGYRIIHNQIALSPDYVEQPQMSKISGKVTDSSNVPLPGVTVLIKGTSRGTVTDADGNYSLTDVPSDGILIFSFVGMKTEEVNVNSRTVINPALSDASLEIDEVVAVGYGTQKKINLTGAVDLVKGEELANRPAASVSLLLQGTSPNLNISNSNRGGEPGSSTSWNIRGLGSISGGSNPLILVDGVESSVDNLDPESIESVSVLKDASASAIYGSRAPYGVVLITTKKGTKDKGVHIQYNFYQAWASPIRVPSFVDALTWSTAFNQAAQNAGIAKIYSDEQLGRIKGYMEGSYQSEYDVDNPPTSIWNGRWRGNANYNWPEMFYRDNSPSSKHNINVEGGDDHTQYYISLGYYDQGGLYNWGNDSYKRYNLLANVTSSITTWLRFDFSTRYSRTKTDYPLGIVGTARDYNLREFMTFGPHTPMYLEDGVTIINPLVKVLTDGGRNKTTANDLLFKFGAEVEPVKGWKTNVSFNYNNGTSSNSQNPVPVPIAIPNGATGNVGTATSGAVESMSSSDYYIFNVLSSYEKKLEGHYFKLLAGYEQELENYKGLNGSRMDLISPLVPSINAATGTTTLGANSGHWATEAIFGRFNYNYNEKYLFEVSGRYNGSSRFDKDSRWGFFPSFSAGYNISRETFWTPIEKYVNTLKIRASYGSLGNQNVSNYLYLSQVPVSSNLNYIINNERPIYAKIPAIVSNNLTWETVSTFDVGIDASTLKNRLDLTFDVYTRTTDDMFGPAQDLPAVLGTTAPLENNAKLRSRGFELSVSWKDRVSKEFSYHVRLSLADNKTTILRYKNDDQLIDTWYNGKAYGEIWGLTTDKIMQSEEDVSAMSDQSKYYSKWGPGDIAYRDFTDDEIINEGTRTLNDHGDLRIIGNSTPRYNVGMNAGFEWKNFDFSMFWQGTCKRDYFPDPRANVFYGFSTDGYTESSIDRGPALNYWRPADEINALGPNTDSYFPKPYFSSENMKNHQIQTRYLLSAAYLRLKNVQIGYTIPQTLIRKLSVKTAKIYLSAENLITLTKLPEVFDPETVVASDSNYGGLQQAGAIYPLSRVLSCGLNITF